MAIKDNFAGRKAAEETFDLMGEYIKELDLSPEAKAIAWRNIGDRIDAVTRTERQKTESTSETMSREELEKHEAKWMKFGKFGPDYGDHKQMGDIPLPYLSRIDEDEFPFENRRYLRTKEIWEQQEHDD